MSGPTQVPTGAGVGGLGVGGEGTGADLAEHLQTLTLVGKRFV